MSESDDEDSLRIVKITVVGEPSTGKSSVCARYLGAALPTGGATQGANVLAGQCLLLRPPPALQLCDVGGAALHTAMLPNYLYAADIVLFVYDLTNLQSFERLELWMDKVKKTFEKEPKKPLLAIFGNKTDLEHQRAVRISVVQKFASEHLLENFKGSAKTGEMVNDAFTNIVARLLGSKVHRVAGVTYGKSTQNGTANGHSALPLTNALEPTQSLIMNRKALRKWKASSSVCCLQ